MVALGEQSECMTYIVFLRNRTMSKEDNYIVAIITYKYYSIWNSKQSIRINEFKDNNTVI